MLSRYDIAGKVAHAVRNGMIAAENEGGTAGLLVTIDTLMSKLAILRTQVSGNMKQFSMEIDLTVEVERRGSLKVKG